VGVDAHAVCAQLDDVAVSVNSSFMIAFAAVVKSTMFNCKTVNACSWVWGECVTVYHLKVTIKTCITSEHFTPAKWVFNKDI
jgi:hypothetical protein